MPAQTPQEIHRLFAKYFAAKDGESQLALYEPADAPVELAGQTAEGARRQADGAWPMLIDNPYGG